MTTWTYWEGPKSPAIELCIETIARHNADFRLVGPDDVQQLGGGDILQLTANRSPQVRADLVRLWLLANHGGQWIDTDCITLKPLDMAGFLNDRCEFVGFCNGAPRHFSNAILASKPRGRIVSEALRQAVELVRSTPAWQRIPYGATGQGILAELYRLNRDVIHRCDRWRYAYLHFRDVTKFQARNSDWNFDYVPYWNPNACCYHLTGKGLVPLHGRSRDQLLASRMFAGFLFRRALGFCRPKRSEAICRRLPRDRPIRGVEVGVLRGRNARVLLQQIPNLHLTLVDLWAQQLADSSYVRSGDGHARKTTRQWEAVYQAAQRATRFAADRVDFLRMDSVAAAERFENGSVDFVFVDGDHSYEGCRRDVEGWWSKVTAGGWIGGHDYGVRDRRGWGVKRAVDEFTRTLGIIRESDTDATWFLC